MSHYYVIIDNMNSTDKKQKTFLALFSAIAIIMTLSPLGTYSNINIAFAGGNHHDDDNEGEGNSAAQIISQVQHSLQNSQAVSGDDIEDSGNNFNFQNQDNSGNNAGAQRGGGNDDDDGDDDDDGNDSNQGIGQSQSSHQNSQCVAGGSLSNSCNNVSFQNQDNSGNNAAGQEGDGNDSNQGIGQDQDNKQTAQCVSGEDAIVSCNNVSFQNQVNSGFNVLGQG